MRLPPLNELMQYKNQRVIQRFRRNFPQDRDRADMLFQDMLGYLWLSQRHAELLEQKPDRSDLDFMCVMHQEMVDIDEMWHIFILHTQDYFDFCDRYFGGYLHHIPNVAEDHPQDDETFFRDLQRYLSFAIDELGAETIRRWFHWVDPTPSRDSHL